MPRLDVASFKQDYSRLVVRYGDEPETLRKEAKQLIADRYSSNSKLRYECLDWLKSRK